MAKSEQATEKLTVSIDTELETLKDLIGQYNEKIYQRDILNKSLEELMEKIKGQNCTVNGLVKFYKELTGEDYTPELSANVSESEQG